MLKNNVIAFLFHIFISFVFFLSGIFLSSSAKWDSAEAARNHNNFVLIVSLIILLVSFFLYYYIGKKTLDKQKNVFYNFLSVSSICIVGIILWIIAYSSGVASELNSWVYYLVYNSYSMMVLDSLNISNGFIFLLASFVPSVLMTLGLETKKSSKLGE